MAHDADAVAIDCAGSCAGIDGCLGAGDELLV